MAQMHGYCAPLKEGQKRGVAFQGDMGIIVSLLSSVADCTYRSTPRSREHLACVADS